jgi:hypothetical protein
VVFSDFYLFHHLLSPTDVATSSQVWLTCEDPQDLVRKYAEYAHGDSRGEPRIVLDQDTLPRITQAGNLQVVSRADLLERFLATLAEQARLASDLNEHLLVLIFGHGDFNSKGVYIGGSSDPIDVPRLDIASSSDLKERAI